MLQRRGAPGRRILGGAAVIAMFASLAPAAGIPIEQVARAAGEVTSRISTDAGGAQGNGASQFPTVSGSGRYVTFESVATNLVPGDTNNTADIFLRDRVTNSIALVSVDPGRAPSNGPSNRPTVSDDGRFVAFESSASNLVPGDTNATVDVFVRDLQMSTTVRASVDAGGTQGNGGSSLGIVSSDGAFVAFMSMATNLVLPDVTPLSFDVFVRDLTAGTVERVSVSPGGTQANASSSLNALSADGRFVAFSSEATNLVSNDTNSSKDVFVRDRLLGTTTRESVDSTGGQSNGTSAVPTISGDGRYVAFESSASDLVANDANGQFDVFVHDRTTGATILASRDTGGTPGDLASFLPAISRDGQLVAFESRATNLVDDDTNNQRDIFVRRLSAGITTRESVDSDGTQANDGSETASVSSDGSVVVFMSPASNLVASDTNFTRDVFARTLAAAPTPTPDLPVMFVHGINGNFNAPGFQDLLPAIESQTESTVGVFHYYQDRGSLDGGTCNVEPLILPSEPNGGMPVNAETAGDICDSQSDLALNVTRLHHDLQVLYFESGQRPVVLVGNSEGVAIIRGLLAYSAELQDDVATTMVDSAFFLQGAQAGSKPARDAIEGKQPERLIGEWAGGIDFSRPAAEDLAAASDWYQWANPPASHVPDLPYFNVYGDMEIAQITCFLFWCNEHSLFRVGDGLIYPGVDDPHAVPAEGGARFLPNGAVEAQQWQWPLYRKFLFDPAADGLGFLATLESAVLDPIYHGNFGNEIDEIQVSDCADDQPLPLNDALLRVIVGRVTEAPYACTP